MTTIEKLKAKSIELRKAKDRQAPFAQFLLAEVNKVGKDKGRETTDDEAIVVLKKALVVATDNRDAVDTPPIAKQAMGEQIAILDSLLPTMVDKATVKAFIMEAAKTMVVERKTKGVMMATVKAEYGALVDMKMVGQILADEFNI